METAGVPKSRRIRETFDMSSTRYCKLLNAVINLVPATLKHDPMLVKRIQLLCAGRMRQRTIRCLGFDVD